MRRRLFIFSSAVSAALCLVVAFLWGRSQWCGEALTYVSTGGRFVQWTSRDGDLYLSVVDHWPDDCTGYARGGAQGGFGPLFARSLGMNVQGEKWGVGWSTGYFSIATAAGKTVFESEGEPFERTLARTEAWPLGKGFEVRVPYAYVTIAPAILPLLWLIAWAREGGESTSGPSASVPRAATTSAPAPGGAPNAERRSRPRRRHPLPRPGCCGLNKGLGSVLQRFQSC